jgi:hypothetical protein
VRVIVTGSVGNCHFSHALVGAYARKDSDASLRNTDRISPHFIKDLDLGFLL